MPEAVVADAMSEIGGDYQEEDLFEEEELIQLFLILVL